MRRRCGVVSGGHRRRVARSAQQQPPPPPQRGRRVSGEDTGGAPERQALFNDIAGQYDLLNDVLSAGQHRVWKQMAVRWSRVGAGGDALDVCCGSGDLALALAAAVGPSGSVTGLDFAVEQLRVASRKQAASGAASRTPMRWVEGDALHRSLLGIVILSHWPTLAGRPPLWTPGALSKAQIRGRMHKLCG